MGVTYHADVAILGAGPAGTAAAVHLGQLGVKNVVLVDRADFPRDKTCGSGLSPKGIKALKQLGVWDEVEPESYWIKGLRLVTPGDREVYVSGGDAAAAVVCNRRTLDHIILKRAISLGVQFVPSFLTTKLIEDGGRVRGFVSQNGDEVHAKYTIIADGAHSRFTVDRGPKQKIQAIMGWWDNVPFKQQHVEMVFDKMVSPFYGWLFPENDGRVNIGICYEHKGDEKENARELFQRFLDKHYAHRLSNSKQIGDWKGHPIVYSYEIEKLYSPGRIVIGEAGRMTHPATAEGISQGMRTGIMAAEALSDILANRVGEAEAFAKYQAACKRSFWISFNAAKIFRKVIDSSLIDNLVAMTQQRHVKMAIGRIMAEM